ncbi:MAG: host cell division inhibitor Icd-like protein [Lonepinella koalarum]|nr:host cell division inhibitor Icd-like protein [Lonepinella koalarum]
MLISDFTKAENLSIIRGTTTYEGSRNPYSSGIFLSQIHTNNTAKNGAFCSFIEFAIRLRDRTKAEFIRTNKIRHSYVAVETVSHPIKGDTSLLTKPYEKNPMKTPQKFTALYAGNLSKPHTQETFALSQHLPKCGQICYSSHAVAKSTAEPRNSNNQTLANSSTPLTRAFFVRSTRTPKERHKKACSSMVACSGKGSPFAVFQSSQFCSPLHVTAQPLQSLAVAPQNLTLELSAMMYQFIFAAIRRTDLTNQIHKIRISATSELEARKALARDFVLVLAGRINLQNNAKTDRTFHPVQALGVAYV